MPREFTSDWVTHNTPTWTKLLAPLAGKPNLVALEIGSYEGRSACWFLENILTDPSCVLYCVDPWGWCPDAERRFDSNIADTGRARQVRKIKSQSRQSVPMLADSSLDFAYIDGSHEAADTLLDGLLVFPLLKIGAVCIFDDYLWKGDGRSFRRHLPGVGIDAFLALNEWRIEVVHKAYQVAIKRTK